MGTENRTEFKPLYVGIFSLNYLFQGMVTSTFAVIVPIYLLSYIGVVDVDEITTIATIIMIPWILKIFFGMITDKVKIKNLGRRKPWIIGPMCLSGLMWIVLGIPGLVTADNAIIVFLIIGFFIATGGAFADTAIDGLILDICPKEKLGRTQGFCWGFRSIGMIAGGPIMALLVVLASMPVETLFIILGILMIISSFTILVVKESSEISEVIVVKHLKLMFNNKKDLKVYVYALFTSLLDGIASLLVSIVILVQMGLLTNLGTKLSLPADDLNIYIYNGNINLIISIGIVLGSIIGGRVSDLISRRLSAYLSFLITTVVLLLMLIPVPSPVLLFFSCLIGFAIGYRHSAYSPIVGQYSKRHPEMSGTYFSVANSFANLGSTLGIALTGIIFGITLNFWSIFLFMAVMSNFGLIGLMTMDPADYENK